MKVFLLYNRFMDRFGKVRKIGGVETYTMSLAHLMQRLGYGPVICQMSAIEFHIVEEGVEVKGFPVKSIKALYRCISGEVDPSSDLVVFMNDQSAARVKGVKTLGIQHGIYWDIPRNSGPYFLYYLQRAKQVVKALCDFGKTRYSVCVDYNFYNWYKTFNLKAHHGNKEFWIIPNYANEYLDVESLERRLEERRDSDVLRIMFARRFYEFRGAVIFTCAVKRILEEYPGVCVTFAGEGPYEHYIREALSSFRDRVEIIKYLPDESFKIHLRHDIAVVPTTGSEGTSLSLLEAMGAGCIVVCTPVGGMSNIVLDGYNGFLTMPDAEALYHTLKKAIASRNDGTIVRNAVATVRTSFSRNKWEESWTMILRYILAGENLWH